MTVASQVQQTLATLKNARATLEIYATQSQNQEGKSVFATAAAETSAIIGEVEERLKLLEFEEPQYRGL